MLSSRTVFEILNKEDNDEIYLYFKTNALIREAIFLASNSEYNSLSDYSGLSGKKRLKSTNHN